MVWIFLTANHPTASLFLRVSLPDRENLWIIRFLSVWDFLQVQNLFTVVTPSNEPVMCECVMASTSLPLTTGRCLNVIFHIIGSNFDVRVLLTSPLTMKGPSKSILYVSLSFIETIYRRQVSRPSCTLQWLTLHFKLMLNARWEIYNLSVTQKHLWIMTISIHK